MAAMNRQEVFEKVRAAVVDALSVDEDEVSEAAKLTTDLGAESIDFLDIQFRLEKAFGIKISQDELFPREVLTNPKFIDNRKLNADGLTALRRAMPHADLSEFEKNPDIDKFANVFTVGAIINFVQAKLAA